MMEALQELINSINSDPSMLSTITIIGVGIAAFIIIYVGRSESFKIIGLSILKEIGPISGMSFCLYLFFTQPSDAEFTGTSIIYLIGAFCCLLLMFIPVRRKDHE
ncbi:hypothetical protein [Neisseria sp. Ec49-e6-T10]|uniref:hypothetical protein n=1 Tax=Neisseria sp. Ec49-e6-T10 TaxID=3140744 RepID=UPI003EB7EE38